MTTATAKATEPVYTLLDATFTTQTKASNWAFHVARTGQRHCRVTKISGAWRVSATPLGSAK